MTNHHKTYCVPAHTPKDQLIQVPSISNHFKDNFTRNNCELRLTPIQRYNQKVEVRAKRGPQKSLHNGHYFSVIIYHDHIS